jgi:hypothetical protein
MAEWVSLTGFSAGVHTVAASFSGDVSFNASSSSTPLNFTITKISPAINLGIGPNFGLNTTVVSGTSVTVTLIVGITALAEPPSGTVTFYLGNKTLGTATLGPPPYYNPSVAAAYITVSSLPVGTNSVTASYSGDSNYDAGNSSNSVQVIVTPPQLLATLTATPNASSLLPTQDLTVTASVAGVSGQPTPTGYVGLYAYGQGGTWNTSCTLANGSCSFDFGANYWSPGALLVDVSYSGDATYAPSGVVVPVTMLNTFTMTAAGSVSFVAGAAAGNTAALTVTPANGFTGPVYFACTIAYYPPGAQHLPTCSVPASVSVTGASVVTSAMTISSTGPTTLARSEQSRSPRWLATQSLIFVAGILVVGLPLRRRVRLHTTALGLLIVLVGTMVLVSCGGGGSGGGSKTVPGTTPGTYKFMVDGAYTQNVSLTAEPFFYSTPQVFVVTVNIQ